MKYNLLLHPAGRISISDCCFTPNKFSKEDHTYWCYDVKLGVFWAVLRNEWTPSARMYVLAFQDQHTLPKWNILSNCFNSIGFFPCSYEQRENISLWEGVLVLEGQYIHMSRENKTLETEYFWSIDTCEQREYHSYQYIHKTVQNQVCWHYTNVMKNSNFSIMNNFPLLLTKPKFITFIPS